MNCLGPVTRDNSIEAIPNDFPKLGTPFYSRHVQKRLYRIVANILIPRAAYNHRIGSKNEASRDVTCKSGGSSHFGRGFWVASKVLDSVPGRAHVTLYSSGKARPVKHITY